MEKVKRGKSSAVFLSALSVSTLVELLSCCRHQELSCVELCERHIYFLLLLPPLSCPCSEELWKTPPGNGSSSQSTCRFKRWSFVSRSLPANPTASTRHLSGCRSETQHPVTQTAGSPGRRRGVGGLTCQLPVEKWGHSVFLLGLPFLF